MSTFLAFEAANLSQLTLLAPPLVGQEVSHTHTFLSKGHTSFLKKILDVSPATSPAAVDTTCRWSPSPGNIHNSRLILPQVVLFHFFFSYM